MTDSARRCRACGSVRVHVVDSRPRVVGGLAGESRGASELSKAAAARGVDGPAGTDDRPGLAVVGRRLACRRCGERWSTVEIREADLLDLVRRFRVRRPASSKAVA